MTRISRYERFLGFAISVFVLALIYGCNRPPDGVPTPIINHRFQPLGEINQAWSKINTYVTWNGFSPMLGATDGMVCYLGGVTKESGKNIICLAGSSGDVLWQEQSGAHTAFSVGSDGLYVGYSGITGIRKYELDGTIAWSHGLPGNGTIYLQSDGSDVQILINPIRYFILAAGTGDVISELKDRRILFRDEDQSFEYASKLESYTLDEKKLLWSVELDDALELAPRLTKDVILVRTGRVSGSVYAIEKANGKILWKTAKNVVSTIAVSPAKNKVYFLTRNADLIEVDLHSGVEKALAAFSPKEITLNGDAWVGGYEVAIDEKDSIIFVSLGDSGQLFGLENR